MDKPATAKGWVIHKKYGLIFLWATSDRKDANKFPVALSAKSAAKMAFEWLVSDEAKQIECVDEDADCDHDGSNSLGWRVFVGEWGHVGNETYSICAVKPAYLWHGK
jgi:hypothetical protein